MNAYNIEKKQIFSFPVSLELISFFSESYLKNHEQFFNFVKKISIKFERMNWRMINRPPDSVEVKIIPRNESY